MPNTFLSPNQKYLVGIYGGVGSLAGIDFQKRIIEESMQRGAAKDQDHPTYIMINAAGTPDRTTHLLYPQEESPVPFLVNYAQQMEKLGAAALLVTCNTAHAYFEDVQQQISIPWIHLMEITARHIKKKFPSVKKIGILATDGTIQQELYQQALQKWGLIAVVPPRNSIMQRKIMDAIYHNSYGIKATGASVSFEAQKHVLDAAMWCVENNAELLIPACTEISLAINSSIFPYIPIVDPLTVAAKVFLDISYGICTPDDFYKKVPSTIPSSESTYNRLYIE